MTRTFEIRRVRRVVTGEDGEGRSIIVSDGPTPNFNYIEDVPIAGQVVWATGEGCADGDDPAPAGHYIPTQNGPGGSVLRIADFPPDELVNPNRIKDVIKAEGMGVDGRHFWFHKTPSLDYGIVLEGEIYAMMDEGETLLRQGDVLVQRGTSHSWSNRSGKWCRMAFVLLGQ